MAATTDNARRLNDAILGVSKEVLAVLMIKICQDHPSIRDFVEGHLLVNESQVPRPGSPVDSDSDLEDSEDSDDDDSDVDEKRTNDVPEPTQAGPKKLRMRYATCINCKEEFDVSENTRKSCSYHPEYPEPDTYLFADHDERCHGPMDTAENRRDYPEKFMYPCCDRYGDEEPCTTDWHREYESYDYGVSKRQKY